MGLVGEAGTWIEDFVKWLRAVVGRWNNLLGAGVFAFALYLYDRAHLNDPFSIKNLLALFAALFILGNFQAYRELQKQNRAMLAPKPEQGFHAWLNLVMPWKRHPNSLILFLHATVENRGTPSELRDWEVWAKIDGVEVMGAYAIGVLGEPSIQYKAGKIGTREVRAGAHAVAFAGATIENLEFESVTMKFWDAFGRQYEARPANADSIIKHFPTSPNAVEA